MEVTYMPIDINSDVGESFGAWTMGFDRRTLEAVTSANIACGSHAGDPSVMTSTVKICAELGVAVGAHPGYPDLQGFGRRDMSMSPAEVKAWVLYQVGALWAIARSQGVCLTHVKAHGALYNRAAVDPSLAAAIAAAVAELDLGLVLVGLAGSVMEGAAHGAGVPFAGEAFPDRAYTPAGTLVSRTQPGALIADPEEVAARAVAMARDGSVVASDGSLIKLNARTLCVHGDSVHAADTARAVRAAIEAAGIDVAPLSDWSDPR
jgi:UPF0271 protein